MSATMENKKKNNKSDTNDFVKYFFIYLTQLSIFYIIKFILMLEYLI